MCKNYSLAVQCWIRQSCQPNWANINTTTAGAINTSFLRHRRKDPSTRCISNPVTIPEIRDDLNTKSNILLEWIFPWRYECSTKFSTCQLKVTRWILSLMPKCCTFGRVSIHRKKRCIGTLMIPRRVVFANRIIIKKP